MERNYKIIRKIGQGGFGEVNLVKNSAGKIYVIKSVPINVPEKYSRNEVDILKDLNHPRIIKLIDFYDSSNDLNIVLEFAPKGSLRDLIKKYQNADWQLPNKDIVKFFKEIICGVQYLHSKKIIHRDLKPENILIDAYCRLKLADFGISKIIDEFQNQLNHSKVGSFFYMAPEVYLHKPYDQRSDIWALGMILYEMSFMERLFSRDEVLNIMNMEMPFKCPVVDWSNRNYDQRFQTTLEMMLQRNAADRSNIEVICNFNFSKKAPQKTRARGRPKKNTLPEFKGMDKRIRARLRMREARAKKKEDERSSSEAEQSSDEED